MACGEPSCPTTARCRGDLHDPEPASVGSPLTRRSTPASMPSSWWPLRTSTKGYSVEASRHVTIVVDRKARELVGAAMAVTDASAAIHECVLAINARVPIDVLAERIYAFPSTSPSCRPLCRRQARAGFVGAGPRALWMRLAVFALAGVLLGALAAFLVRGRRPGRSDADRPGRSHAACAPADARHAASCTPPQPDAPRPADRSATSAAEEADLAGRPSGTMYRRHQEGQLPAPVLAPRPPRPSTSPPCARMPARSRPGPGGITGSTTPAAGLLRGGPSSVWQRHRRLQAGRHSPSSSPPTSPSPTSSRSGRHSTWLSRTPL